MASAGRDVVEVTDRRELRTFRDLPALLYRDEASWRPPLRAFDTWRLDVHRNPFFERGDAALFLARRLGRPVGRISAHVESDEAVEGWFGFFDSVDDPEVARALVDAAVGWHRERGRDVVVGPYSFAPVVERGIRSAGFELPAMTGLPWHPPHASGLLEQAGLVRASELPWWILDVDGAGADAPTGSPLAELPPQAGAYHDPRLVLADGAAVPDVATALAGSGLRSVRTLARRARARDWERAVVVRVGSDVDASVAALRAAAGAAGYRRLVAPCGGSGDPQLVYRTYRAGPGQPGI